MSRKKTLRFWAAGKRAAYNATLQYLRRHKGKTPYWTRIKAKIIKQLPNCYKEVPYQIKGDAVREAWQAVTNAKIKAKQTGERQDLRFQSRRMPTQSLFIPSSAIHENGIYPRLLGDLQYAEELPANFYKKRAKGVPKPIDEIQDLRLLCDSSSVFRYLSNGFTKLQTPPKEVCPPNVDALTLQVQTTFASQSQAVWKTRHHRQRGVYFKDRLLDRRSEEETRRL